MKKCTPILFVLALLLFLPMQAMADETVSLKVGYISLSPDGSFRGENTLDTSIDIEDDLGAGDGEGVTAELALQLGSFRLSAGYLPLKFSGTSTPGRTLIFNGQPFNVGETVTGEMDVNLYDLGLTWHLLNFDDLPVRFQFGPELAIKVIDGQVSMDNRTTGIREEVSGTAPVPTIGARARVGFADLVAVVGRLGYIGYSGNTFLDADLQLEFSPLPFVGIYGGYRHLGIDVDEADIVVDASFAGPYVGAFARF